MNTIALMYFAKIGAAYTQARRLWIWIWMGNFISTASLAV